MGPNYCGMFRRCCCYYAPTIIVMDLVLILVLIGEIVLVFPDRKVAIIEGSSTADDGSQYGLKPSVTISPGHGLDDGTSKTKDFYLWEGSSYSVFVIPANTLFISIGLRLLFCKLNAELMKVFLMVDLMALYISSTIGLICYVLASSDGDDFKTQFFLQYIIMAVSLVLGFLTQIIALLIISYALMKTFLDSINRYASVYQDEYDKEERERLHP